MILFFSHIGFSLLIQVMLLLTFIVEIKNFLMRKMRAIKKLNVINNQRIEPFTKVIITSIDLIENNPVFEFPAFKDRENF